MKACFNGHAKMAEEILKFLCSDSKLKAEIDAVALDGWTAMHAAARHGDPELIRLLYDKGANLSVRERRYGDSPLLLACYNAHVKVVKVLLEAGVHWSDKDREGNNALHKVCMSSKGEDDDRDKLVDIIMAYDGRSSESSKVPFAVLIRTADRLLIPPSVFFYIHDPCV